MNLSALQSTTEMGTNAPLKFPASDEYVTSLLQVEANVPARFLRASLESYTESPATSGLITELVGWTKEPGDSGVYLSGPYGVGKTSLAVSLLRTCIADVDCYFISVSDLLAFTKSTMTQKRHADGLTVDDLGWRADPLDRVESAQILVLDDIGESKPTEWSIDEIYRLVNQRHGALQTTIFTSNFTLDQLAKRLGERLVWRIAEMTRPFVYDLSQAPNLRA